MRHMAYRLTITTRCGSSYLTWIEWAGTRDPLFLLLLSEVSCISYLTIAPALLQPAALPEWVNSFSKSSSNMRYYVAMMHWDISVVQKSKKIFLIHESYSLTFSRSVFISSICRFKSPTSASESSFSMLIFLSCRCRLLVRHSSSRSTSIASFSLSCCASVIFESS